LAGLAAARESRGEPASSRFTSARGAALIGSTQANDSGCPANES
jgi:hypothetical protein